METITNFLLLGALLVLNICTLMVISRVFKGDKNE